MLGGNPQIGVTPLFAIHAEMASNWPDDMALPKLPLSMSAYSLPPSCVALNPGDPAPPAVQHASNA